MTNWFDEISCVVSVKLISLVRNLWLGLFARIPHLLEEYRRVHVHVPDAMTPTNQAQLVLSGDFCQLPPVPDKEKNVVIPATFAFDAKSWNACVGKPIALTKVFRQKDQRKYTSIRRLP